MENNYGNILQRFVLRNFSYFIELVYPKCSYARQTDRQTIVISFGYLWSLIPVCIHYWMLWQSRAEFPAAVTWTVRGTVDWAWVSHKRLPAHHREVPLPKTAQPPTAAERTTVSSSQFWNDCQTVSWMQDVSEYFLVLYVLHLNHKLDSCSYLILNVSL